MPGTVLPRLVALPALALLAFSQPMVGTPHGAAPKAALALVSLPAIASIAGSLATSPASAAAVPPLAAPVPVPVPASFAPTAGPPSVERARDGLFYIDAQINGSQIRFLVDTGATTVTLTPEDARRIGATAQTRPGLDRMQTASGAAAIQWARLGKVRIGGQELQDLDAVIVSQGLPVSLLGQNALSKFQSVTIKGHRLHLD